MKRYMGFLVMIFSNFILIQSNGNIAAFWHLPTFLYILFAPVAIILTTRSWNEICAFEEDVQENLLQVLNMVGNLGAIVGFIQMIHNFSDPKAIGPGMAICLLSVLYSEIFSILLLHNQKKITKSNSKFTCLLLIACFFCIQISLSSKGGL